MLKIFLDGATGLVGRKVQSYLHDLSNVELMTLSDSEARSLERRQALMLESEITLLCVHEDAARSLIESLPDYRGLIIDTSPAFRIQKGWDYGLIELGIEHQEALDTSRRIAHPGCYATGVIVALRPLLKSGLIPYDQIYSIFGISGYSAGGQSMMSEVNHSEIGFRSYAPEGNHRHVPEMVHWSGLAKRPMFIPCVGQFEQGIQVHITIPSVPGVSADQVLKVWSESYQNFPWVKSALNSSRFQTPLKMPPDEIHLWVSEDQDHNLVLIAQLDNLEKGAARSVVQHIYRRVRGETNGLV